MFKDSSLGIAALATIDFHRLKVRCYMMFKKHLRGTSVTKFKRSYLLWKMIRKLLDS